MLTVATLTPLKADLPTYVVAPNGSDSNPGTLEKPFATLQRAQEAMRQKRGIVKVRGGVYYLPETLRFTPQDSGSAEAPAIYEAYENEKPILRGGVALGRLDWKPYRDGIMQTKVPEGFRTDQLFVNGELQPLARFPDFDPKAQYFNGSTKAAEIDERSKRWKDPIGGLLHEAHRSMWGSETRVITGRDANGALTFEGGGQTNRPPRGGLRNEDVRFVENIFEELDAPGEWFLDEKTHTLYFYPPKGLDLAKAVFEGATLKHLIEFEGTPENPVRFVIIKGLIFQYATRTFMETTEKILRSDWAIYRGGVILFQGTEDCAVEDCVIEKVGGNAVFVSNYNRRMTLRGSLIREAGGNGVVFLGDPSAVRSPTVGYDSEELTLQDIDRTPGPSNNNYPAQCLVEDCLIYRTGRVEKQTSPVTIDMAEDITVRHVSAYDVPRAGINIGDGCWGGHVIEFCDVFDTVLETGDHGSFNSWGRDRFWKRDIKEVDEWVSEVPELPFLDAQKPNILRNNRWRCDHGWDVDLDDGSTNYIITNNLLLNRGLKLREGYRRIVTNNIMLGPGGSLWAHLWYKNSGDVFSRNIVVRAYLPVGMRDKQWGQEFERNLQAKRGAETQPAADLQKVSGRDETSLLGDPLFVDPQRGDYRVQPGSPALELGFENFPMDQFGVQKPELRAIARQPIFPPLGSPKHDTREANETKWQGITVRNILDVGEMSAYGLPGVTGVLVTDIPAGHPLLKAGLQQNDVIINCNGRTVVEVKDLVDAAPKDGGALSLGAFRLQTEHRINLGDLP